MKNKMGIDGIEVMLPSQWGVPTFFLLAFVLSSPSGPITGITSPTSTWVPFQYFHLMSLEDRPKFIKCFPKGKTI